MLTKAKIKLIKSLHEKKYRNEYGLFLVEGEKSVKELLKSDFKINYILGTKKFFDDNADILKNKTSPSVIPAEVSLGLGSQAQDFEHSVTGMQKVYSDCKSGIQSAEFESTWIPAFARMTQGEENLIGKDITFDIVEKEEIEKVSGLESNDSVLAVVFQKENISFEINDDEIILALDDIRDPGNLGTIIRIADWYGIKKILSSESTVDQYNNKTISATKGSFTRVQIFYTDLEKYLKDVKVPVLGTFMKGENVHNFNFPKGGILVMGNESNGISKDIEKYITSKITIPAFGEAESLNVGIATAVVVDNWRRGLK
jgi:TrmH family RNA methyltransferase